MLILMNMSSSCHISRAICILVLVSDALLCGMLWGLPAVWPLLSI